MENHPSGVSESSRLLDIQLSSGSGACSRRPSRLPQVRTAFTACLGGVGFGTVLGYSSPTIPLLNDEGILGYSSTKESWFTAIVTIGAILGGYFAGFIVAPWGRKLTLMLCGPVYMTGWMMIIGGGHIYTCLLFGRFVIGIGMGMSSFIVPLYIAETASKDMRGLLGANFQVSIVCGIFLAYVVGIMVSWQWLAVVCAIVPTLLVILLYKCPETPRWLLTHGRRQEALDTLRWLRGSHVDVEEECKQLENNISSIDAGLTFMEMRRPRFYKPACIALVLMASQQLTGINVLGSYAQPIFKEAGFVSSAEYAPVIMGALAIVSSIGSCFLQDRVGRRPLLISSGFSCGCSTGLLGIYFRFQDSSPAAPQWLALVAMTLFVVSFALAWGPTVWVVVSEILPVRAKGLVGSVSVSLNWIISFILTKEFLDMEHALDKYGSFWFFSIASFLGTTFVIVFVPETKGCSLEQIERQFETRNRRPS